MSKSLTIEGKVDGRTHQAVVPRSRNEFGEYVVRFYVDGVHQARADYHTDDRDDAIGTAEAFVAAPVNVGA